MVIESQILKQITEILVEKLKFEKVENVSVRVPQELKGEHFATQAVYVQIHFTGGKIQNLFLKIPSDNESHRKVMSELKVMEKECAFYNEFLPAAQQFCSERGCENILDFLAPCLYADDIMILLKNLVLDEGFEMLPKSEGQSVQAVNLALSSLAKLHAVSYAMIQELNLENFKHRYALTTVDLMTEHDFINSINKGAPQFCLDVLKTSPVDGSEEAVRYLTEYSKTVGGKLLAEKSLQTNLVTLTHGDFWNNNMLFKKDPQNGQLLKNVLVDFQATKLASTVIDITNFL